MRSAVAFCLAAVLVSACGQFPRDPEGTLQRIRSEGVLRVGVASASASEAMPLEADRLVQRVAAKSGAQPQFTRGEAEPLLDALEEGKLDLVLGNFEKKSPWAKLVSFSPPLRVQKNGKTVFHLTAAMRNGENAWVALVEREVRDIAPEAQ